ncbi:hypothetical protein ACVWW3_007129 [Bradyrhizobium sp. LM2.9]
MQDDLAIECRSQMQAVRHHQEAAAGARDEIARQGQHVLGGGLVEIAGRLVRQQQRGLCRQRTADRDPLLLPA